ncbi:MAG TPA: type IV secretion system DNA-binding domain-containing protein [Candidatus Levybacteria bacterium]|nr:type IV secretion system DNA-binding domain-containing protein [Candidatus Levybacteria bacterium]
MLPDATITSIVDTLIAILLAFIIVSAMIAGSAGLAFLYGLWRKNKLRHEKGLAMAHLEIRLPRDNEIKIDAAEQMFASFASIKTAKGRLKFFKVPDSITFEIVARPQDVRFYVSVPKKLLDLVEKQIHGSYPDAQIEEVEEYNIFENPDGKVAYTMLKLDEADHKPIRTFKDLPVDPLSTFASTLGKMQEGEAAAIQIIITPADSSWKSGGRSHISDTKKQEADPETAKYSVDQKELEAVDQKMTKAAFETFIRIVAVSSTEESADAHLGNIVSAFTQFSGYNSFTKDKMRWTNGFFMVDFIYRYLPLWGHGSILNTEELATLFHFPNKSVDSPSIHWMKSRLAPAPANVPTTGMYVGKSIYRGISKPIYLQRSDRRRHMYIIGKTGVGKSEFLKDMILQDIRNGEGVCFIDPHDTIDQILPLIPPERAEDVILFDPSDTTRPMGLNMIEASTEEQKHFMVASVLGLMYKLFDPHQTGIIGPRFEHAVRNAMLTVMAEEGNTFIEVVRILTDPSFVQELLPKVNDPMVRRYWTDQIAQTSDFHKSETLDYIVSKFGRFVTNKMMRNMIGQSVSAFNFRQVMDEKKILFVSLAKGKIGEENSNFLGLVLVPKLLSAAMSRQDMHQDERKDFYLYVDEFQNFATPDFATILSEARKYRLNLTVANQFIGQMDEDIKNAIFGNVGTIVSFRVGVTDANYLQHEFQPNITEGDLINVERYHAYVKTQINEEPVPPFSLDLTRDVEAEKKQENPRVAELVKELSRLKYGRPVELVEAEIAKRSRLFEVLGDGPEVAPPKSPEGKLKGNV